MVTDFEIRHEADLLYQGQTHVMRMPVEAQRASMSPGDAVETDFRAAIGKAFSLEAIFALAAVQDKSRCMTSALKSWPDGSR